MNPSENSLLAEATAPATATMRILVLYEDLASGQRARAMLTRLSSQLGIQVGLTEQWWHLDVLADPVFREPAAVAAGYADLVLLSVERKTQLSTEDREWLGRWLHYKEDRPYLLCVMQGTTNGQPGGENSLIAETRQVAQAAGMDFFSGTSETSAAGSPDDFKNLSAAPLPFSFPAACHARAISGVAGFAECQSVSPATCANRVPFGNIQLCKHPRHREIVALSRRD